ncbi:MAG: 2OG-Fe(II) oxygenase [Moraxellaceae bacterium]|nr:2OG-Fe(II) oxygenase [Pseudobdellovibrionaceae bacterium]
MKSLSLEQLEHLDQNGWICMQIPDLWLKLFNLARTLFHENQFEPARIKSFARPDPTPIIRNDLIHWLTGDTTLDAEIIFNQHINMTMNQLKDYFRIGLDHFEAHYAHYGPGKFYQRHSDQKKEDNKRQFSFVYYLNPEWKPEFGGELVAYRAETNEKKLSVLPDGGTFILFKSDIEHEVCPSKVERFSISGWMRTR